MSPDYKNDKGGLADLLDFAIDITTLAAAVSFALGLWLSLSAGIFGLPLSVFLVPWFANYLFVILKHAALGRPGVPVLAEEMVNPVHGRPLFIFFLLLVFGVAYWSVSRVGGGNETIVIALAIILLPAMIIIVVISDNPFRSLNPVNIFRLIFELRLNYAGAVLALALLPVLLPQLRALNLPTPIVIFILLYWLLIVFRFLGHGVYLNRTGLGVQVEHAPEITAAKKEQVDKVAHKACLDEIHLYSSAGHYDKAYQTVCEYIYRQDESNLVETWFLENLLAWENKRVGVRLAQRAVSRLLADHDLAAAWRWCELSLQPATDFRAKTADEALTLANYATQAGRRRLAYKVLQPFTLEGGNDLLSSDGMLMALKIASEDPALLADARRLSGFIVDRWASDLQPDDLALIRAVRDLVG
jgi:hypothetical protein